MKKSYAFETVLVVLLICLAGLAYYMIASASQSAHAWEKQANGSVDYMYVGDNDMLYTFGDNNVSAYSKDGDPVWQLDVPAEWNILNTWSMPVFSTNNGGMGSTFTSYPIVEENNGSLYLLAIYALNWTDIDIAKNTTEKSIGTDYYYETPTVPDISKPAMVMKISPDGKVDWEYSFNINISSWDIGGLVEPQYFEMEKPIAISVYCDRIYVFHDYTVDVLDGGGNRLFSIPDAAAPAAVDNSGNIYIVQALHPSVEQFNESKTGNYTVNSSIVVGNDQSMISEDPLYMLTSDTVQAYGPDGSPLWSRSIGYNATRPFIEEAAWPDYNTLPLYSDNRLFVPIEDGAVALGMNGSIIDTTQINDSVYTLFPLMPLDSQGNVYMVKLNSTLQESPIYAISPDGHVTQTPGIYDDFAYYDGGQSDIVPIGGSDGVVYSYNSSMNDLSEGNFNETLISGRFNSDTIDAYSVLNGTEVWNFTIPQRDVHIITLNADIAKEDSIDVIPPIYPESDTTIPLNPYVEGSVMAYHGQNITYLDYYYSIYETPFVSNRSRCIYARGIYAIGNNGTLLWELEPNGSVDNIAVGNETVYYSLDNGRIGGTTVNIAAGAVIAAIAYLFLRLFMMGTVSRARGRIDKNENRNKVLKYLTDNPGSTLRDIARGTRINHGTVRYHVFILGVNHRITSYMADDKHVRYFTNSGMYSKEDQLIISMMRREMIKRIIQLVFIRPGLTNTEISGVTGIVDSGVSRYLKELCERGIVLKSDTAPGRYTYSLSDGASKTVEKLYWVMNGEVKAQASKPGNPNDF